jgi:hypothetical protein
MGRELGIAVRATAAASMLLAGAAEPPVSIVRVTAPSSILRLAGRVRHLTRDR